MDIYYFDFHFVCFVRDRCIVSREYSLAHLTHWAWISRQSMARKRRRMVLIMEIFIIDFCILFSSFHLIYIFYLFIFHCVTPTRSHPLSATVAKASLNNHTLLRFMFHQFAVLSIFDISIILTVSIFSPALYDN